MNATRTAHLASTKRILMPTVVTRHPLDEELLEIRYAIGLHRTTSALVWCQDEKELEFGRALCLVLPEDNARNVVDVETGICTATKLLVGIEGEVVVVYAGVVVLDLVEQVEEFERRFVVTLCASLVLVCCYRLVMVGISEE